MTTKHTPGPWYWVEDKLMGSSTNPIQTIIDDTGCKIKRDVHPDVFMPIINANKRLIAAAPDLLAVTTCI